MAEKGEAEPPGARLLSGGNPQVGKGDGDAPVQAWIAALPGWKREPAARIDTLVGRLLPGVRRAVRWNTPFYGVEGRGWFLGIHAFDAYLKLGFFRGAALDPPPPVASRDGETRYLHIREGEPIDEARLAAWVEQTALLPGRDFGQDRAAPRRPRSKREA